MSRFIVPILSLLLFSCGEKESSEITEVTFGRFCGECWRGNCAPMYRYSANGKSISLYADTSNNYFQSAQPKCEVRINDTVKYKICEELIKKIPPVLLEYDEYTFGKPDDHDQCGMYLEFVHNGERKKFIIDPSAHDDVPKEVTQFASQIDERVEELMK